MTYGVCAACSTSHWSCCTKSNQERDFSISHSWTAKVQTSLHFSDKNAGSGLDPNCLVLKCRYSWKIVLETVNLENTSRWQIVLKTKQNIFPYHEGERQRLRTAATEISWLGLKYARSCWIRARQRSCSPTGYLSAVSIDNNSAAFWCGF